MTSATSVPKRFPAVRGLQSSLLILLMAVPAAAQTSTWWTPLGSLTGTRYNPARTNDTTRPVVKWKTSALRNSRTLLIGALRPESVPTAQQVIGQMSNEVRVLRSNGFLDTTRTYARLLGPDYRLTITGLFNIDAPTPEPVGRANTIGLGVERAQTPGGRDSLFSVLADWRLDPFQLLRIRKLEDDEQLGNRTAAIFPIAVYRPVPADSPIAVTIVSQDAYTNSAAFPARDTMVNGFRGYRINRSTTDVAPRWQYILAPKSYARPPAMVLDPADQALIVSPSLSTYDFQPFRIVSHIDPRRLQTRSDQMYAFTIRADQAVEDPIETRPLPIQGIAPGELDVHYAFLSRNETDPGAYYQLVTENHSPAMSGRARVYLRTYRQSTTTQVGLFEDTLMSDIGWSVVTADLDGTDRSFPRRRPLVPNRGLEIIGARQRFDGGSMDTNRLYLMRYNDQVLIDDRFTFGVFAEQPFRGRLLAAGDVVLDSLGKDEIVIADRNVLQILRFRRFGDQEMLGDNPSFFETIASIPLDAPIVSAAIADLEGDGANDVIVTTELSTYAIGRPVSSPLGIASVSTAEACVSDTIGVIWNRAVGGGDGGMIIVAIDQSNGSIDTLEVAFHPTGDDRYRIEAGRLAAGRYRLRIVDADVRDISAMTAPFNVVPPSIGDFEPRSSIVGESFDLDVQAHCAERLQFEYSFDGASWSPLGSPVAVEGGAAHGTFSTPCPPDGFCSTDARTVWYRFSTLGGELHSVPKRTTILPRVGALAISSADSRPSRRRFVRWDPSAFGCEELTLSMSFDDGVTWQPQTTVRASEGSTEADVPGELEQTVGFRLCCSSGCGIAAGTSDVSEIGEANFAAPNPFDPRSGAESPAAIIYRLTKSGTVTVAIYDAARVVVRTLISGEPLASGLHRATWDGSNSRGEVVADGAYICLISSSSGERISFPISIAKR